METANSFNRYGKVHHELEDAAFHRRRRRRIIILTISILLVIILVVALLAGSIVRRHKSNHAGDSPMSEDTTVKAICSVTLYPDLCYLTLLPSNTSRPEILFRFSLMVARESVLEASKFPDEYMNRTDDPFVKEAMRVCKLVLDDAASSLNDSISAAAGDDVSKVHELRTWLSAAVTDQETCLDALAEANANATFAEEIRALMKNSTELVSNSLAIVTKVFEKFEHFEIPARRKMLGFPEWIGAGERRMILESSPTPNVTVAKDGTGDVETIKEAVARIPKKSKTRFIIYIKAGKYEENVEMDNSYWNVMMYGDGMDSTIVSGNRSNGTGYSTLKSATFSITGNGFIARDMAFRNTAGPENHQAVAFRSGSDLSVLYRCSFEAFQDTLYAHTNRQFYRECFITGTVDFIFGNSAAVFQSCTISPRQPMPGQFVTITAQGKTDPNQNTGTSIQGCNMTACDATACNDLSAAAATYLGRPWKEYSTTVVMESDIGKFLDPKGWSPWEENKEPPVSIFYGEYRNRGEGARTRRRVKWPGYTAAMTAGEAGKYGVRSFIQGSSWLPATRVPFDLS